jgi:hypothetical protein
MHGWQDQRRVRNRRGRSSEKCEKKFIAFTHAVCRRVEACEAQALLLPLEEAKRQLEHLEAQLSAKADAAPLETALAAKANRASVAAALHRKASSAINQ